MGQWSKSILLGILFILTASTFVGAVVYNPDPEGRTLGDPNAPVTIEFFTNFQEPYSARWYSDVFPLIKENYIDQGDVKLIVRHFPWEIHQNSMSASKAAQCAAEQDRFFKYIGILYDNQQDLEDQDLEEYADDVGLNMDAFRSCFTASLGSERQVNEDIENGQERGVSSLPTFYINDEVIHGAGPYQWYADVIDKLLGRDNSDANNPNVIRLNGQDVNVNARNLGEVQGVISGDEVQRINLFDDITTRDSNKKKNGGKVNSEEEFVTEKTFVEYPGFFGKIQGFFVNLFN